VVFSGSATKKAVYSYKIKIKQPPFFLLSGREKKFKNQQNRKICLNEIKYLQLLIFAKGDFFSCPASLLSNTLATQHGRLRVEAA
jgi:hypothetical protein